MPAFTPNLNLYKPGGGSTGTIVPDEVADIDRLNANYDLIDAFAGATDTRLDKQESGNQQFVGLSGGQGAITGMKIGDTYQETDVGKRKWEYDGANWVTGENGLYLIRPTSVVGTGVAIDNAGHVSLTATNTKIELLGLFSARFDHYLIEFQVDSATSDNGIAMQFKTGGVDIAAGYFGTYSEQAIGVPQAKTDINNAASFAGGRISTGGGAILIDLFRPSKTVGTKDFLTRSQDSANYLRSGGGSVNTVAVLDGISFIIGAITITAGRIKVYGYR